MNRIRVGQVVPSFVSGGIERYLELLIDPMREAGIDFTFISHSDRVSGIDLLKKKGVPLRVLPIPWRGTRYWLTYPSQVREMLKGLQAEERLDFIHTHHSGSFHVGYGIARRLGLPLILSNSCMDEPWQTNKGLWASIDRRQIREAHEYASKVICVGEAVKLQIAGFGWQIKDLEVVEPAASDEVWQYFNPSPDREFDVVMMGRLSPQKNVLFAIDVFARLKESIPGLRVAIVGDGQLRDEVEASINRHGLTDNIRMFGHQPLQCVYEVARTAKVLYAPSFYEGLSVAVVEALALSLSAVLSTIPSFQVPFKGLPGIEFCNPGDLEANAAALTALVANFTPLRRPEVEKRFRFELNATRTIELYREMVAPPA